MIGPSTALCAAHCFYNQNGWIQSQSIAFGADTVPPGPGAPFGSSLADSVTLPGAAAATDITLGEVMHGYSAVLVLAVFGMG
jgi:hypothetical protein